MSYAVTAGGERFVFDSLATLLGKASEEKSGDQLAGLAAVSERERVAAKWALADLQVAEIVDAPLIDDEVTGAVLDSLDRARMNEQFGSLTIGELREVILSPGFA